MAIEIGFQKHPNTATSSATAARFKETQPLTQSKEPAFTLLEKLPEKKQENREQGISELRNTVAHLNESVQELRRELRFSVDEDSGRVVVKVINAEDGETIRQIPAEELLQLARRFTEGETEGGLLKVIA